MKKLLKLNVLVFFPPQKMFVYVPVLKPLLLYCKDLLCRHWMTRFLIELFIQQLAAVIQWFRSVLFTLCAVVSHSSDEEAQHSLSW